MKKATTNCPCGGPSYESCCAQFIETGAVPDSAEQLMRSRYSAYVLAKEDYLRRSWHKTTRPQEALIDQQTKWLGLEIRRHEQLGDEAIVEFVARYKIGGRAQRLHEVSRFVREDGNWYYVNGSFPERQQ